MSVGRFLQQAAAGAGEAIYVDDLFSTHIDYSDSWGPHTATTGLDMSGEGGMVWTKPRGSGNHWLYDTERGATKALSPDQTAAEATVSLGLKSFTSTGFTFDLSHVDATNGQAWWSWRKQPGFFDVVTYTGTGSAQNISHNLGSTPGMIIVKNVDQAYNWTVYHRSMGGYNYYNHLNQRSYTFNNTAIWNAAPTSTVFSVGTSGNTNNSGDTYVAYLFAHDAQDFGEDSDEAIIKCGSYTGNGNDTGPIIDLGFEPQWVMIKDTTTGNTDWFMFDTTRNWNVVNASELKANTSASEAATIGPYRWLKPLSNGFQITDAATGLNTNGNNHIYMAIRRPHKPASKFAATELFSMDAAGATSSNPCFVSNSHVVDMAWEKQEAANTAALIFSRLTGSKYLNTTSTGTESTGSSVTWDYMNGCLDGFGGADTYQAWMWRRAPGFFDVVAYTGSGGSTNTINHNLGVVPEMMWVKRRDGNDVWWVYHKDMTGTPHNAYMILNTQAAVVTNNDAGFGNTAPTATQFTVGGFPAGSGQAHIAYFFASVNGISKVGSYTGTGSDINVDCGFSSGARFVLIKRSDSTGDWYYYDSVRGIVAGNDPYLFLNTTAAQVTNTDYIDPLSSGFTITSSAPAALNTSGGTYLFLAIA